MTRRSQMLVSLILFIAFCIKSNTLCAAEVMNNQADQAVKNKPEPPSVFTNHSTIPLKGGETKPFKLPMLRSFLEEDNFAQTIPDAQTLTLQNGHRRMTGITLFKFNDHMSLELSREVINGQGRLGLSFGGLLPSPSMTMSMTVAKSHSGIRLTQHF